tara:strand:- start:413 stop:625 length:213 start_codon:yes stop_codon:yes gene_type:complete
MAPTTGYADIAFFMAKTQRMLCFKVPLWHAAQVCWVPSYFLGHRANANTNTNTNTNTNVKANTNTNDLTH